MRKLKRISNESQTNRRFVLGHLDSFDQNHVFWHFQLYKRQNKGDIVIKLCIFYSLHPNSSVSSFFIQRNQPTRSSVPLKLMVNFVQTNRDSFWGTSLYKVKKYSVQKHKICIQKHTTNGLPDFHFLKNNEYKCIHLKITGLNLKIYLAFSLLLWNT